MNDFNQFENRIIAKKIAPERKANYRNFPDRLLNSLQGYLKENKIKQLYSHQAEMFEKALDGKNIVITTSTASGKTLSFLLPVVQEILKNPMTRAIFVYPTKALANDQYRNIQPLLDYFGKNKIQAGVYDGDTPVNERSRIRNSANIILTNPEMINTAFLPNHNNFGFNFIFSNLKYVVIDELHTYRGTFGSHLSNLIKRLNRICTYYHASPQYLCSSATIANPVELAEKITGKRFSLIDQDGSPAPEKHYYIWQPPMIKGTDYPVSPAQEATELLPELVMQDNSFIAFCKARKTVEVVLKEARDKLKYDGTKVQDYSHLISGYRGGYKPKERKEIENNMVNGNLKGLVSTNALELGIDIGSVESTVLVGFPGTRASFWQQSGRAGRSGVGSSTFLLLDNLPFDQYIGINPEWLFSNGSENAVVDTNNLFIQLAHVRAGAAEIPLSLDDISIFPQLGEIVPVLIKAGELRSENGKFTWIGPSFPAGDYSLRNMDKERYKLVNKIDATVLTEMDELQAYKEIHQGAIYLHDGLLYQVENLDVENRVAYAVPMDANYYTASHSGTAVAKIKDFKDDDIGRTKEYFGDAKVTESVTGYKRIQFHNHQNLGYEELTKPLSKAFETEGVRLLIPKNVDALFRKLVPNTGIDIPTQFWKTYFGGMSYALLNATLMLTMATKEDVGTSMLEEAINDERTTSICIYDRYIGGLGYAEKAFDHISEIIDNAVKMVSGCKCNEGCPACIGDYNLDKSIVLWGLNNLYEQLAPPKGMKVPVAAPQVVVEKKFDFLELQDEWSKFTSFMKETGEYLSEFLSSVQAVKIEGSTLFLILDNPFYKEWMNESDNKGKLKNMINHYVNTPKDFAIDFKTAPKGNVTTRDKISRRYSDLTR
ncbi:DEAD/DEAH box helicase [Aquibacillus albus]|uniref:DEAD/DEAH box helicase domain-containing protein n=1 Tax=Aquibacillus albus TaxID=1168171 RepID=A0ABS2N3N3_9BACI|nr:DEAD/DEAH box helicase [Aquibacillus albus]MBM7572752.1 DEAD/DEAH box helicase domain-containing protein [Aquibacillus albus]